MTANVPTVTKNGDPVVPIFLTDRIAVGMSGGRGADPSWGFDHLARADARRARADTLGGPVNHGAHSLEVGVPASIGLVVGVAHVVSERGSLAANIADSSHFSSPGTGRSGDGKLISLISYLPDRVVSTTNLSREPMASLLENTCCFH